MIRLLKLLQGREEEELCASLALADLEENDLDYDALSYCWGPPVFCRRIRVGQAYFKITENLYHALHRLRLPAEARVIWVDAICIDQKPIYEKNHQVRLMSRIFTQCSRCVIYLGPEADSSELLPGFMGELIQWVDTGIKSGNQVLKRGHVSNSFNSYRGLPTNDDPRWNALIAFLKRPWFRRVWVMQEYILPKKVTTICGDWELEGCDLAMFIHTFSSIVPLQSLLTETTCRKETGDRGEIIDSIVLIQKHIFCRLALGHDIPQQSLAKLGEKSIPQHYFNLINLVIGASLCNTTDPRDRFFGVLGLANDVDDAPSLQPDYGKTLKDVMDAYISFFVAQGNGKSVLQSSRPRVRSTRSWPSWYPCWHMKASEYFQTFESEALSGNILGLEPEHLKSAVTMLTKAKLSVRGFKVDRVHARTTTGSAQSIPELYEEALALSLSFDDVLSEQELSRLVLRVLVQNKTHQKEEVSQTFLDTCERQITNHWDLMFLLDDEDGDPVMKEMERRSHAEIALERSRGGCFGMTKEGYCGMFPQNAEAGDEIFTIEGGSETFLIRHHPTEDTYDWLGEVYIHCIENQIERTIAAKDVTTITVV